MLTREHAAGLAGEVLRDCNDEELGTVDELYPGAGDDVPAWAGVTVDRGLRPVPLDGAEPAGAGARVRFTRAQVAAAPAALGDTLDPALLERLHAHYGITDAELRDDSGFATTAADGREQGSARPPATGGGTPPHGHP